MKLFLAFLFVAKMMAADLGVISSGVGIFIPNQTNRPDVVRYKLYLYPQGQTNPTVLITTNRLLTIEDFVTLPDGPILVLSQGESPSGELGGPGTNTFYLARAQIEPVILRRVGTVDKKRLAQIRAGDKIEATLTRLKAPAPGTLPPLPPDGRRAGIDVDHPPELPGIDHAEVMKQLEIMRRSMQRTGLRRNE